MKLLIIDTCNPPMRVIGVNDRRAASRTCGGIQKLHNSVLMPYIDEIMTETGMNINDVDAIACVVGAGSFTGIRIGIAAATALARGTSAKKIALTEFEAMAHQKGGRILAAIDAGHGNYYSAEFDSGKMIKTENVTNDYIDSFNGDTIIYDGNIDDNAYIAIAREKFGASDFCDKYIPLYLKDSQAEREKAARLSDKKDD